MSRLQNASSRRSVLLPIDHGVSIGPVAGLLRPLELCQIAAEAGCQGVIAHKGILNLTSGSSLGSTSRILHLSASTVMAPQPDRKVLVGSVEEAIRLGADAVSVHVNLSSNYESEMLRDFGQVTGACQLWGMPLVAMMYVRATGSEATAYVDRLCHAARVAAELGADLVKIPFIVERPAFELLLRGCFVPVLIAGGEKQAQPGACLEMVSEALAMGAAGICVGRNAFQQPNPRSFLAALCALVHQDAKLPEAVQMARLGAA